jgi:hypothetical protein
LKKLNIDSHLQIPGPLIVEVDLQLLKAGNFSNEHFSELEVHSKPSNRRSKQLKTSHVDLHEQTI